MSRPLYVAFVGMRRAPSDLPADYWSKFVRFHLELPWYYARHSDCRVHLTTVEPVNYSEDFTQDGGGTISTLTEGQFRDPFYKEEHHPYDVVVHWRKWFDDLYIPGARNVILSQDHSYGAEWKESVGRAFQQGKLDGILVFPTWHKRQVAAELAGLVPQGRLYEGLTLGVDVHVYSPGQKDLHQLLWASDPGRGLAQLITPFLELWRMDRRFKLVVTYPDYVKPSSVAQYATFFRHPGVTHLPGLRNGPELWDLFNRSSYLPYSSTFPEPSSRCHRQAMAAGSVVLYPPGMGTPSELLTHGVDGIVSDPSEWADMINACHIIQNGPGEIGRKARELAVSESWEVQAQRFFRFFSEA